MADAMKLVPCEPTEAMRRAAFDAFEVDDPKQYANGTAARDAVWSAMLSAAPPAVEGGLEDAMAFMTKAALMLDRGEMPVPGCQYAANWSAAHRIVLAALATREEAPAEVGTWFTTDTVEVEYHDGNGETHMSPWEVEWGNVARWRPQPDNLRAQPAPASSEAVGYAAHEIGGLIAKREADFDAALADLTITPDVSSLDELGRSIFGALTDCPAMSIDKQADFVARALWPALTAPPSPDADKLRAVVEAFKRSADPVAEAINRAVNAGPQAAVRLTQAEAMAVISAARQALAALTEPSK